MRTPLRFLAAFLPLLILVTFLTTLQHQPYPNSLTTSPTLLNLATTNPAMASLHKDAENLLAAINIDLQDDRHNRPVSGPSRQFHLHIRLLSTKHHHLLPSLRRSLRSWLSNPSSALVPDLLRLVKRPIDLHFAYPDTGRPYASCAVVGNSGVLLRSELGDLIDGHDLVIRLNNARTAGYEQHVGFKTSLSFINSNVLHLCSRRSGCPCHPNGGFVPIVMYICQAAHFIDYVICNSSSTAPLIVTDPRLDLLCARIVKYYSMRQFVEKTGRRAEDWGEARDERVFHYSSGMQAVVLALGICDQLSLFGFGKSAGMKHHYHNNQKVELDLHDFEAEYAFYGDLVNRPEILA